MRLLVLLHVIISPKVNKCMLGNQVSWSFDEMKLACLQLVTELCEVAFHFLLVFYSYLFWYGEALALRLEMIL